jgi:pilus assembly protein CpaB
MLMRPGDRGFLAAVLGPGMRAISVPVTATSGVAGLVFPGDRVDLILSHQVKDELDPAGPPKTTSETVLTDIRVLAIDQTVTDQDNKPVLAKTVTFEVTPKQVEVIGVASSLGSLSLSLRSLARGGDEPTRVPRRGPVSHTWDTEVSAAIVHNDKPQGGPVITVLRGSFQIGPVGTETVAQRGPGLLGAAGAGS